MENPADHPRQVGFAFGQEANCAKPFANVLQARSTQKQLVLKVSI